MNWKTPIAAVLLAWLFATPAWSACTQNPDEAHIDCGTPIDFAQTAKPYLALAVNGFVDIVKATVSVTDLVYDSTGWAIGNAGGFYNATWTSSEYRSGFLLTVAGSAIDTRQTVPGSFTLGGQSYPDYDDIDPPSLSVYLGLTQFRKVFDGNSLIYRANIQASYWTEGLIHGLRPTTVGGPEYVGFNFFPEYEVDLAVVAVPGPIAGAGLPVLLGVIWMRRRRRS